MRAAALALSLVFLFQVACTDQKIKSIEPRTVRLTSDPGEDRSPSWSPDGSRILFSSDRNGDYEIYSITGDGTGLTRITDNPGLDDSPAWGPSGTQFVFQSERNGTKGLWTAAWPGGKLQLLLEDPSPELLPDWSPDGRWIAFTSERDGNPELYRVEVSSGRTERLTTNPYRDLWPRHFPDGASLLFFSRRGTEGEHDDLYRLDLIDQTVTRLTDHPTHHDFAPDVSPNGQLIVAGMSDRAADRRELVVFNRDGNVVTRFATGNHRVFHPVWSPDGDAILYAARVREGEQADLYIGQAP